MHLRPSSAPRVLASILVLSPLAAAFAPPLPALPTLVSRNATADAGNGDSYSTFISANGRWIAFTSTANNLVPDDTEGHFDVFVRNQKTGAIERATVGATGGASSDCYAEGLSANGRFVGFLSNAANLVDGVTPSSLQFFVHDRKHASNEIVSTSSTGEVANAAMYNSSLSRSGRYAVFTTTASNLTAEGANGSNQAYIHDRKTGVTELVSVSFNGSLANDDCFTPTVSSNGRFVFFYTQANNLIPVDGNGAYDVFVRDRKLGTTLVVSVGTGGLLPDGVSDYVISATGRYVLFLSDSQATDLADAYRGAYVFDRKKSVVSAVLDESGGVAGGSDGSALAITPNGRFVTFNSYYTSIVANDPSGSNRDVFLADRKKSTVAIVSYGTSGQGIDGDCTHVAMSENAKVIAFAADATNLVTTPTNGKLQVYAIKR